MKTHNFKQHTLYLEQDDVSMAKPLSSLVGYGFGWM